jgi:two-component system sensor kinase FixL
MNRTTGIPTGELQTLTVSHLTTLLDQTSDFVGVATLGGDIELLNAAGRALVGLDAAAELPTHLTDYLPESASETFLTTAFPRLREGGRWEGELTLRRLDDAREIPVVARIFYLQQGSRGRRVSMAVICRDISASRLADEQVRTAESALAYATRLNSLGEITASIAHEVSQPLAAILTHGNACLRWLTHAKLDINEARTAAIRIVRDANRASLILDRIRDLARREVPEWTPFDLNETASKRCATWTNAVAGSPFRRDPAVRTSSRFASATRAAASPIRTCNTCSNLSSRPSRRGWASDFRSPSASCAITAEPCARR